MRLLVMMLVIVGGLWLIASVGSARADVDRVAREMGRPLPQISAYCAEEARRQMTMSQTVIISSDEPLPAMQ